LGRILVFEVDAIDFGAAGLFYRISDLLFSVAFIVNVDFHLGLLAFFVNLLAGDAPVIHTLLPILVLFRTRVDHERCGHAHTLLLQRPRSLGQTLARIRVGELEEIRVGHRYVAFIYGDAHHALFGAKVEEVGREDAQSGVVDELHFGGDNVDGLSLRVNEVHVVFVGTLVEADTLHNAGCLASQRTHSWLDLRYGLGGSHDLGHVYSPDVGHPLVVPAAEDD